MRTLVLVVMGFLLMGFAVPLALVGLQGNAPEMLVAALLTSLAGFSSLIAAIVLEE